MCSVQLTATTTYFQRTGSLHQVFLATCRQLVCEDHDQTPLQPTATAAKTDPLDHTLLGLERIRARTFGLLRLCVFVSRGRKVKDISTLRYRW
jgi:hypothetical protein